MTENKNSFLLLILFLILPLAGILTHYFNDFKNGYYQYFAISTPSLRFNYHISPLLMYFYGILCWVAFELIQRHPDPKKLMKIYITSSLIASLYSIYQLVFVGVFEFPHLIPEIFDFRNNRYGNAVSRASGFSDEPNAFLYAQTWAVIFLMIISVSKLKSTPIIITMIATFSTALVAVFGIFLVIYRKLKIIIILTALTLLVITMSSEVANINIYYQFYQKIIDFISFERLTNTCGSGTFRAYTRDLGIEVFKEFPIFGVGIGNSNYYLWNYDYLGSAMRGKCESIGSAHYPQNITTKFMAEFGFLGVIILCLFFLKWYLLGKKNNPHLRKLNLLAIIVTVTLFNSFYPIYNLHVWVPIAIMISSLKNNNQIR